MSTSAQVAVLKECRQLSADLVAHLDTMGDAPKIWLWRAYDLMNRPAAATPIPPEVPADIRTGETFYLSWPYHQLDRHPLRCVARGPQCGASGIEIDTVTFDAGDAVPGNKRRMVDARQCWNERPPQPARPPPIGPNQLDVHEREVAHFARVVALALQLRLDTPSARGGRNVTAQQADVRLQCAGELGIVFKRLTGKQPTRISRSEKRNDVKGGRQQVESGPWLAFLTPSLRAIFGTSQGASGYARDVAEGMAKNPERYWSSIIHT